MLPCSSKAAPSTYSKNPWGYISAHSLPHHRPGVTSPLKYVAIPNFQSPDLFSLVLGRGHDWEARLILAGVWDCLPLWNNPWWVIEKWHWWVSRVALTLALAPRKQLWFRNPAQGLRGGEENVKLASPGLLWPQQTETGMQRWETVHCCSVGVARGFAFIASRERWALCLLHSLSPRDSLFFSWRDVKNKSQFLFYLVSTIKNSRRAILFVAN